MRVVWTHDARGWWRAARYRRWRWGVAEPPPDSVTFAEAAVHALSAVIVNVLAGLLSPALLFAALYTQAMPPLVLYPLLFLAIPIYAVYWSGTFRPPRPSDLS